MQALVLGFCSSGHDFAIPSSRLYLAIQTLGVALRFVGNYALRGLSPQTDGMPVILKTAAAFFRQSAVFLFAMSYLLWSFSSHQNFTVTGASVKELNVAVASFR